MAAAHEEERTMSDSRRLSRRQFARSAAAAVGSLVILPRHVLGGPGYTAPSDTLTKAVVGVGGMGRGHLRYPGSVLRAVCDVDGAHLAAALEIAGPGVRGYHDFREVLEQPDIDIVHVAHGAQDGAGVAEVAPAHPAHADDRLGQRVARGGVARPAQDVPREDHQGAGRGGGAPRELAAGEASGIGHRLLLFRGRAPL
jgi:hypothetical protein